MTKRRALLLGFVLMACAGVVWFLVFWLSPPKLRINRLNVELLVQKGMTLEEVEAIIGGPPGDYRSGRVINPEDLVWNNNQLGEEAKRWKNDEMTVAVAFNSSGKVDICQIDYLTDFPPEESLLTKFRRWLGL